MNSAGVSSAPNRGRLLAIALSILGAGTLRAEVIASATDAPDPVLERLVERSLAASPALQRASAAVAGADARVRGAKASYRPLFAFSEVVSNSDVPPAAFASLLLHGDFTPAAFASVNDPGDVTDWASVLGMRQVLWDGGRRKAFLASAQADRGRVASLEEAAGRDVRFAIADALETVRRSRAEIDLWEDSVRLFEQHERIAQARLDQGMALRSDQLAVAVRVDDARESLVATRRAEAVALARLSAAVGEHVSRDDVPVDDSPATPPPAGDLESLVFAAREHHPIASGLESAVAAAQADVEAARRGRWPTLALDISGQWHDDGESFGVDRGFHAATIALTVPIVDSGRTRADTDEALARQLEAEALLRQAQDELELAVRDAHAQALEASERALIAARSVEAAGAALAIIEARYREGMAPVVELVDAERSLTEARVREIASRSRARVSVAALERLAGRNQ